MQNGLLVVFASWVDLDAFGEELRAVRRDNQLDKLTMNVCPLLPKYSVLLAKGETLRTPPVHGDAEMPLVPAAVRAGSFVRKKIRPIPVTRLIVLSPALSSFGNALA